MKRNGFTLIELIIVVAIVAIVGIVLAPALNGSNYQFCGFNCG